MIALKDNLEGVAIESGSVKCYKIENPGAKLQDTILPCLPWKQQLQKLFDSTTQQDSPFLFVTGILICGDLKVRWERKDASKLGSSMTLDDNALLAALQPPNPELAKKLDSTFSVDQEKRTIESIFATCKHDVIFAVRYHYLNPVFERKPDAKEPNIFMDFFSDP